MVRKHKTKQEKQNVSLPSEIQKLTKQMQRANSFWMVFLRGLVSGAAAAIGATVFAGVVLLILWRLIQAVDTVPVLKDIIQAIELDRLVEEQIQGDASLK